VAKTADFVEPAASGAPAAEENHTNSNSWSKTAPAGGTAQEVALAADFDGKSRFVGLVAPMHRTANA
jgi:hypothetical protein